jgi:hypothetical protein
MLRIQSQIDLVYIYDVFSQEREDTHTQSITSAVGRVPGQAIHSQQCQGSQQEGLPTQARVRTSQKAFWQK